MRARLRDDEWFYASQWGLKDLHFDRYDDEIDHPYHEYLGVEITDEVATEIDSVSTFLKRVMGTYCP